MPDNPSAPIAGGQPPAGFNQPGPSTPSQAPMMPMMHPSKFQAPGGMPPNQLAQCNRCNHMVTPANDTYPSLGTHLLALALFIIGLPFCIFLPYCFDCFGKPVKRCTNCGNFLQGP